MEELYMMQNPNIAFKGDIDQGKFQDRFVSKNKE
jgi:hypothetical protein